MCDLASIAWFTCVNLGELQRICIPFQTVIQIDRDHCSDFTVNVKELP